MGKNKDKIRVSFKNSNAAEDVTGSCTVITYGNPQKTILVDCGLTQGGQSLLKEYQANSRKFSFKEKEVDYIIITHLHGDHSLLLPRLYKKGCKAPIIFPKGSFDIFKEMALDSAKIMGRNSEDLERKLKKNYPPIYDEEDVKKTLEYVKEYNIGEKIEIDDTLTIEFIPSGHIISACQVVLYIKNGNSTKKIAFTGDLGNIDVNRMYTNEFKPIQNANLLVGESTYANKERSSKSKDRDKDLEKIKSAVYTTCIDNKSKILIPSFALMRTQTIATIIYDLFNNNEDFNIPVYIASPLACKISKLFEKLLEGEDLDKWNKVKNWDKLNFIDNFDKIEEIVNNSEPCIFIASAGMMNAGYSVYIAEKLLPGYNNTILFVGYSVEGTLSWKIKQKKTKTVTINGKPIPSRCRVINLSSFSSHMGRDSLIKYYSGGMGTGFYGKIALQHGNFKDKVEFGKELQSEIEKRNRTDKVIIVNKSTEITL